MATLLSQNAIHVKRVVRIAHLRRVAPNSGMDNGSIRRANLDALYTKYGSWEKLDEVTGGWRFDGVIVEKDEQGER